MNEYKKMSVVQELNKNVAEVTTLAGNGGLTPAAEQDIENANQSLQDASQEMAVNGNTTETGIGGSRRRHRTRRRRRQSRRRQSRRQKQSRRRR